MINIAATVSMIVATMLPPTLPTSPPIPAGTNAGVTSTVATPHASGLATSKAPAVAKAPPVDLNSILGAYESRLADLRPPTIVSYEYSVEQAGERSMSQTHRIYRENMTVRDETTAIDSQHIKPRVRIFRNRPDPYAVAILAPRRADYDFVFTGARRNGSHIDYQFRTTAKLHRAFSVTSVTIDGRRNLPTILAFASSGTIVSGTGELHYGPVDHTWMITDAAATGLTGKRTLREHIIFGDYTFPKMLPPSTFGGLEP